jgi:hypothetical protein
LNKKYTVTSAQIDGAQVAILRKSVDNIALSNTAAGQSGVAPGLPAKQIDLTPADVALDATTIVSEPDTFSVTLTFERVKNTGE